MRSKSVCVVSDLTLEEQRFLYKTATIVKADISKGKFPEHDLRKCAYLMFLEDSTRTKESFRNSSETLNFRTNMFDSNSSSLNKFETLNDTVRMLCGYTAMQSVFIIRSKIEGLCKSLSDAMTVYANRVGIECPSFVNAGDGKHEHPTQEFLDEFSFLELLGGKTERIHIALVGDLLLGRTVHSKADGLRIFDNVVVDLVAPNELQLPADYVEKMKSNGFKLNLFHSLDEYLSSGNAAPILYFTRLQLERMDKSMLEKEKALRAATTLRMDMLSRLPKGAKIYHPLPRHGEMPEIPFEVDATEFNGYDEQSRNGYFVRTALLGLITGVYDSPFPKSFARPIEHGKIHRKSTPVNVSELNQFFTLAATMSDDPISWIEVELPAGTCPSVVRKAISRMRVLSASDSKDGHCQVTSNMGYHSIPFELVSNDKWQNFFFSFFAGCNPTIVYEENKNVFAQITAVTGGHGATVSGLPGLGCPNTACVSHPDSKQRDVPAVFESSRLEANKFACRYCEREVSGIDMFQRV